LLLPPEAADILGIAAQQLTGSSFFSCYLLCQRGKALFIDDSEVINLLKNYNGLSEEVKSTFKNMLKALNIYSQVKGSVT